MIPGGFPIQIAYYLCLYFDEKKSARGIRLMIQNADYLYARKTIVFSKLNYCVHIVQVTVK